jgi:hypothetical protein
MALSEPMTTMALSEPLTTMALSEPLTTMALSEPLTTMALSWGHGIRCRSHVRRIRHLAAVLPCCPDARRQMYFQAAHACAYMNV